MARYDREILVPYLRDVCALEMAAMRLAGRKYQLTEMEVRLNGGSRISKPTYPTEVPAYTCGMIFGLALGGFLTVLSIFTFIGFFFQPIKNGAMLVLPILMLLAIGVGIIRTNVGTARETKEKNRKNLDKYHTALQRYEQAQKVDVQNREKNLPLVFREKSLNDREYQQVKVNLQRAYDVNIIPRQYRSIYVAVYLYDWFSTSQADDLDMALNMFVLEEIKDRLDQIIANQTEIILNQYTIIDDQRRFQEEQQAYQKKMMAKMARMEASNEQRNVYLGMIESHSATTAYFAAADYIRKI